MKKFFSIFLIVFCAGILFGCNSISANNEQPQTQANTQTYLITLDLDGGEIENQTTFSAENGERCPQEGVFETPTKQGFTFEGWYTSSDYLGLQVEYLQNISEDVVVYAKWQVVPESPYAQITLQSDGVQIDSQQVLKGERFPESGDLQQISKDGHIFMGWYTEENGQGVFYKHFEEVDSDVTLYASWNEENDQTLRAEAHYVLNKQTEQAFTKFDDDGYIIYQSYTRVFEYGDGYNQNGCGWIATYNVLNYLKREGLYEKEIVIADIIRYYEHYGLNLEGAWGTDKDSIVDYLKTLGLEINLHSKTSTFDELIKNSTTGIALYITTEGAHYQQVHKKQVGFNALNSGYQDYEDFDEYKAAKGFGFYYLITVDVN